MHTRAINDWRDVPEIKTDEQAVEMFGPSFRGVVSAAEKMGGRAAVYVVGVAPASGTDRTGAPRVVDDGSCCGVAPGGRHYETCPRTVAWKATRCGARPPRGAVLDLGDYDAGYRLATGEEACHNGKGCAGEHGAIDDARIMSWTDVPVFVDCAVCASRVMPYGGVGGEMHYKPADTERGGAFCETCWAAHRDAGGPELVWRDDRLVRKDVAAGMEQRLTVSGRELDAWGVACEVSRKVDETDDEYRPRVLRGFYREMSSPLGLQTATAREQARAKGLAELARQGTTGAPEMRDTPGPSRRAALEILDCEGYRLATGAVSAVRVSHDRARVTGRIRIIYTGTASRWQLYRRDERFVCGGPVSTTPGANTMALNSVAFSSGGDVVDIALDVYGSAEEMRALFGDERVKVATASGPASCSACGGSWGMVADVDGWRKRHEETCAAVKRREREAPLVALVAAVPEGLDPIGWRAAVLAETDGIDPRMVDHGKILAALPVALLGDDRDTSGGWWLKGCAAYQRAIAPHKAPPPERRQGGKAVRLTVDDGREE